MTTVADMGYITRAMACGAEHGYVLPTDQLSESADVRRDYSGNGHYFDRDTLRFFGSRNFATVAPGVSVELQTNAPGDRYKVELWRVEADGTPGPWYGCWHATRRDAVRCALATVAAMREGIGYE